MGRAAPVVPIELDKPRNLKFTLNSMVLFEKHTGKRFNQVENGLSMEELRILLWACLIHEDPDLTPEQVGDMIHAGNLERVAEALHTMMSELRAKGNKEGSPTKNRHRG
ncbi:hypothetical protein [Symbiobacterium thermophilum]|uniref:Uncharacterized protein n=1 Tax=Symbiobacterium thermophilum TaxID=2734 RepID=A0A953LJ38_SYMTR|nr:hypothetical protein [Symbiobacterium thermophilum]MBY6275377.1 hypothetical protein [Symbiobacterium thermophilum]